MPPDHAADAKEERSPPEARAPRDDDLLAYTADSFPEDAYLAAYADVREAVAAGALTSGWSHYLEHGRREIAAGERPPFGAAPGWELAPLYLAQNPDIALGVEAGLIPSAQAHWERHGRHEEASGARPSLPQDRFYAADAPPPRDWSLAARRFDGAGYRLLYPDLRAALAEDEAAARTHWLEHGREEGRHGPGVAPFAARRARFGAVLERRAGIDLHGAFAATDAAARNLWHALRAAGIAVDLHPFDTSRGAPRITAAARARPPGHRVNLVVADPGLVVALAAAHASDRFDDAYNIGFWPAALAAPDPGWSAAFGLFDEIWTASAFARDAIAATAPVPVRRIGVPLPPPAPQAEDVREAFGLRGDAFVFLLSFDAANADRRNPLAALRAFHAAFAGREDVQLVIKYRADAPDRRLARELARATQGAGNVVIIAERLSAPEMAGLVASADCVVSPHRATGFGLGLAEAMNRGKPVIATDYGGSRELIDDETGFPVRFAPVERAAGAGGSAGAVWAEPDEAALAAQMRRVEQDRAGARRTGAAAARRVQERFGLEAVGARIAARLAELGLDRPAPPFAAGLARSRDSATPTILAHLSAANREALASTAGKPLLSVVVPLAGCAPPALAVTLRALRGQLYPAWELCLLEGAELRADTRALFDALRGDDSRLQLRSEAAGFAAEAASGAFVLLLAPGVALPPGALLAIAREVDADPALDALVPQAEAAPGEAVELTPERLRAALPAPGPLGIRKRLLLTLAATATSLDAYTLALGLADARACVRRLPAAAMPVEPVPTVPNSARDAGLAALQSRLDAASPGAARAEPGARSGAFRIRSRVAPPPVTMLLVSGAPAGLEARVSALLAGTEYPTPPVIALVSGAPAKAVRLRQPGWRVEADPAEAAETPAARLDRGWRLAETEYLIFLDDRAVPADRSWLATLAEAIAGPFADPAIAGAGGRSEAMPERLWNPPALPLMGTLWRRSALQEVGGIDRGYGGALAAADLALRLREAGARLVQTPYAVVPKLARGPGPADALPAAAESARFQARWGQALERRPDLFAALPWLRGLGRG